MGEFLSHNSKAAYFDYIMKNLCCAIGAHILPDKLPGDLIFAQMAPGRFKPPHPVASLALAYPVRRQAQSRRPVASLALAHPVRRS